MHTVESSLIITTVILTILGCMFMEIQLFERGMLYRDLSIKAEQESRLRKEPFCRKEDGFIRGEDEAKNIYTPLLNLLGNSKKEITENVDKKNWIALWFFTGKTSPFTKDRTQYQETVIARNFDPLEVIRITDQFLEIGLDLKRRLK